ncbi:MAG: FtsW/RodA/SpoVE family cell cycle protein, partial [Candidatus Margulisiibacteriota bacterium]
MINLRMLKLSDVFLWLSIVGLISIGCLSIFSTTFSMQVKLNADPLLFVKRQIISLLVAFLGLTLFSYLDYKHLKKISPYLYLVTISLLVAVFFVGGEGFGAQRWLQLGFFSFQPSELSKFTIIISLASFLSDRKKISNLWEAIYLLALVGVPFFLIFKQPDLGTALVFYVILVGMLFASEYSPPLLIVLVTPVISLVLRPVVFLWLIYIFLLVVFLFLSRANLWDWFLVLGINIGVGVALPFIWAILKPYQQQRIIAFLNPEVDPYGAGYHSLQSKIAIGSGGILGRGFLRGT